MNRLYFSILISVFTFLAGAIMAQQTPKDLVKKDYLKLYNDFKSEVGGQKAHYIIKANNKLSGKYYTLKAKFELKNLPLDNKVAGQQMESMFETSICKDSSGN